MERKRHSACELDLSLKYMELCMGLENGTWVLDFIKRPGVVLIGDYGVDLPVSKYNLSDI